MSLKTEFADYARHELGRADGTVRQYLWRLGYLERALGKPIEQMTASDLRQLKRQVPLSSATIKSLVMAAHAFHAWGALEGHWGLDGIMLVHAPREVNESSRPLRQDEVHTLKAVCRAPIEYRLVYLGLYAGMRIGESARFQASMWEPGFLRFRSQKGRALIETPVHPDLLAVQAQVLASPTAHVGTLQKTKERLAVRSGVKFVAQQLRKSFASSLYDADVPDEVVKNLLGHTGDVTRRYAPVSRRKRIEAIEHLYY